MDSHAQSALQCPCSTASGYLACHVVVHMQAKITAITTDQRCTKGRVDATRASMFACVAILLVAQVAFVTTAGQIASFTLSHHKLMKMFPNSVLRLAHESGWSSVDNSSNIYVERQLCKTTFSLSADIRTLDPLLHVVAAYLVSTHYTLVAK